MRWLDCITNSMDTSLGKLQELSDGQGGLACCGSWGRKESDTTEQLNLKTHFRRQYFSGLQVPVSPSYRFWTFS